MRSSTSPSERRLPRFALAVILVALVTWGVGVFYTLGLNPELRYFRGAARIKERWARKMTQEHGPKIITVGGSSCEFSLDAARLLDRHGMAAVNLGRGAGMGASILTQAALEEVRPGDTLVMAVEQGILTESMEPPALGVQFSIAEGHPEWFSRPAVGTNSLSWPSALLALRPGGYHAFTMLGKMLRRQPLYRYQVADVRPSGFVQTPVRMTVDGPGGHSGRLTSDAQVFLSSLRQWCDARGVRVAYSLPWTFTPPPKVADYQRLNAQFLLQVAQYLPVLRDPRLGAYSVREHFADTGLHLVEAGAAVRTDELAAQLKDWRVWSLAELQVLAQAPPAK